MSPMLQQLLSDTIIDAVAAGIAKYMKDPEAQADLVPRAQVSLKALTDELERLEANQQSPRPPKFWRDHEPMGADPEFAGAVRYTK